ncbi:SRPBCC domain-containing protein [Flammeovirgaceae bacterium SG7u.111]|nr:SRPBCC domain-containing protein [Flammeovirgaceae bacterium SG7u.132]WPO36242.1 SRPBCC domain-containing protein [Flammeovirgaceae bacterium SG7u.111]
MKTLRSEIVIEASAAKVWEVLMNHEAYPEWNPFIKKLSGNVAEGNQIAVMIQPEGKSAMDFTPIVLKNEKNKEFRWLGKLFVKGLFDGEHFFKLEKIDEQKTKLIHGENFSGVISGVLLNMLGESTQKGFEQMNEALKLRVESAYSNIGIPAN